MVSPRKMLMDYDPMSKVRRRFPLTIISVRFKIYWLFFLFLPLFPICSEPQLMVFWRVGTLISSRPKEGGGLRLTLEGWWLIPIEPTADTSASAICVIGTNTIKSVWPQILTKTQTFNFYMSNLSKYQHINITPLRLHHLSIKKSKRKIHFLSITHHWD